MRLLSLAAAVAFLTPAVLHAGDRLPNVVVFLADDLGYGDLGCYGQAEIRTPNADRLAARSLRFTQCYAGCTVCAPSRCCLMTGKDTGHATIRGNADKPLNADDRTVAEVFKAAGYRTGLIGKWGLGEAGTTGEPNRKGFDHFFGYLNQTHAHNYFPDYLFRNRTKVPYPENVVEKGVATKAVTYSPDLMLKEALEFLDGAKAKPFFLEFATTLPHANNERGRNGGNGMEIPSDAPYSDRPWPAVEKNHAAMITRLDADLGAIVERIEKLGLTNDTLIFFTSDNGPHREGGADPAFFKSGGGLRGIKRSLYEGGIRVPMLACWPGKIQPGTSTLVWAFWDFLPTVAELTGQKPPKDIDGVSVLPTLLNRGTQAAREYLYWEFHEAGSKQAIRTGDWKAVRNRIDAPLELYDLAKDRNETANVAKDHPDTIAAAEALLKTARTESKEWPLVLPKNPKK